MTEPLQPILVVLVYRGGERIQRALDSILEAEQFFGRIILSVTAAEDSDDMRRAIDFRDRCLSRVEVICTGTELPTMQHQAFWVHYLEGTGGRPSDWIYWLAYDDQVKGSGIGRLVDEGGNWPLEPGTSYFGPWAMRHEAADQLFDGPWDADLEAWTSFPIQGPTTLPVAEWIAQQLLQPTYMQMSGSVTSFESHHRLVNSVPRKKGPMRIEMATAAAVNNMWVAEFAEPVVVIYGRSNSDRSNYAATARKEDLHLIVWLAKYELRHPRAVPALSKAATRIALFYARVATGKAPITEELRSVRSVVRP